MTSTGVINDSQINKIQLLYKQLASDSRDVSLLVHHVKLSEIQKVTS